MNNAEFSPSRRAWNRFFTAAVWVAAALVIVLVAGIIAMVLARGDRKSTRLNSSHREKSRMPSSA